MLKSQVSSGMVSRSVLDFCFEFKPDMLKTFFYLKTYTSNTSLLKGTQAVILIKKMFPNIRPKP